MTTSLSHSIRRAYAWTTVGNVANNLAAFGISLVLAHLLGPQEFRLLSMAIVFTNIPAML
jgi:O-antigen/teichoic acid export membrane protein